MIDHQSIIGIREDLKGQEIFIHKIISMIQHIGIAKRDSTISDLEIGFQLGEVFRMLHEFAADSGRLRIEIDEVFKKIYESE